MTRQEEENKKKRKSVKIKDEKCDDKIYITHYEKRRTAVYVH
jgi:hypothetical protein